MIRNNDGWGLKEMLFLSAILLFFVLAIAFFVHQLYGTSSFQAYTKIEQNLEKSARKYFESTEINYVTSDELILKDYLSLKDLMVNDDLCEGYVLIEGNDIKPYIHCENYETKGY